jgi:Tfp pilus assembly protein PilV
MLALAAAMLLLVVLLGLSGLGYRVYKKVQADQRLTATAQAAQNADATYAARVSASASAPLLTDPLATNNNNWLETSGMAYFQDGQYHLHNSDPNKTLNSYYKGQTFSDARISITVTCYSSGNPNAPNPYAYGLILRANPDQPGNKYVFLVTPSGTYDFARHDDYSYYNNGWTDLTQTAFASSSAIRTGKGATNTLTIVALGNVFTLSINGQKVETVADSGGAPYVSGWLGLLVEGADMEAGFSNLLVYQPGT